MRSKLNEAGKFNPRSRYNQVSLVDDPKVRSGRDWAKNGGNFPVLRNGSVYYVSRSVSVSLYAYCKNRSGEWCVLANKRGNGAQNAQGLWNVPCGYLDYNESAEHAAAREAFEETGVKVPINKIVMMGVNSTPRGGRQDVTMRFSAVLDGVTVDYPTSMDYCEEGEVSDVRWIPLSQVDRYQWCYGMGANVLSQAKTSLGDYENGGDESIETTIAQLRREISSNPRAMHLFKKLCAAIQ